MTSQKPQVLRALRAALLRAAVIGLTVATCISAWELAVNPGGVFRQSEGWHWPNILATAWSWFYPVFLVAAAAIFFVSLLFGRRRATVNSPHAKREDDGR